jgi:hypothetical protein
MRLCYVTQINFFNNVIRKNEKDIVNKDKELRLVNKIMSSTSSASRLNIVFGSQVNEIQSFFSFASLDGLCDYIYNREMTEVKCIIEILKDWKFVDEIAKLIFNPDAFAPTKNLDDTIFQNQLEVRIRRKIPELILSETSDLLIFRHNSLSTAFGNLFIKVRPEHSWSYIPVHFLDRSRLTRDGGLIRARICDVKEGQSYTDRFYSIDRLRKGAQAQWEKFDADIFQGNHRFTENL